jgi:hypothetical protein
MLRRNGFVPVVIIGCALLGAGCGGESEEVAADEPAMVEAIEGTDLSRVVLTSRAAQRIGVRTAPTRGASGNRTVIPYDAVLYDPNGATWTYTSPQHLVFVRKDITVDRIDGERAILSAGPASGTPVVTVGATEIWGVEYGGIEED